MEDICVWFWESGTAEWISAFALIWLLILGWGSIFRPRWWRKMWGEE